MNDNSWMVFMVYIVGSRHTIINTAIMYDPHIYMGTVDTLQWEQERENNPMNASLNEWTPVVSLQLATCHIRAMCTYV